jgi:hypothetical protein
VPTGAAEPAQGADPAAAPETTPLPVSSLPGLPGDSSSLSAGSSTLPAVPDLPTASPSLSPGGNASGLFPTLDPKSDPGSAAKEGARQVANTSALPEGAPVVGAQLAGLAALALAFVLTVTRLSFRRRGATPARKPADSATAAGDGKPTAEEDKGTATKPESAGEAPAGSADTPGGASPDA